MSFKDAAAADLPVFLNTDEFADTIEIDGVPLACVLDETETTTTPDGVYLRETTLHARAVDVAAPVPGQRMEIGDRLATVLNADEAQGMRVIRLRWFDS